MSETDPPDKPEENSQDPGKGAGLASGLGWLIAAFSALAAVLTLLGITEGTTGRMLRNEQVWALVAFIFTLLAVAMGVLGKGVAEKNPKLELKFFIAGVAFFFIGGGAAIVAGVSVWSERPSPNVAVAVIPTPRGDALRLNVKSSGLKSGNRVVLSVWPLAGQSSTDVIVDNATRSQYSYTVGSLPLYEHVFGPDADGNVDENPLVPLPLGHSTQIVVDASVGEADPNGCLKERSEAGCVILGLGNSGDPQLRESWTGTGARRMLSLKIAAHGLGLEPLHILVAGRQRHKMGKNAIARRLAGATLSPGPTGTAKQSMHVPVPGPTKMVCAVVSPLPITECPPRHLKEPERSLVACVMARAENLPPEHPTSEQLMADCHADYARYVREATAWEWIRAPR